MGEPVAASRSARLTETDHERLKRLSRQTGLKQQEVIARALVAFERDLLLESINSGFEALQADAAAWSAELAERAAWDATGTDVGAD